MTTWTLFVGLQGKTAVMRERFVRAATERLQLIKEPDSVRKLQRSFVDYQALNRLGITPIGSSASALKRAT